MKKKSQRMQIVSDLYQREENQAADVCEGFRLRIEQEVQKLEDLDSYYREYEQRFNQQRSGLRALDIVSSRTFLNNLNEAIKGQQHVIQQFEEQYADKKRAWLAAHLKRENMDKLVVKYTQQEKKQEDLQEQKLLDDWVLQTRK